MRSIGAIVGEAISQWDFVDAYGHPVEVNYAYEHPMRIVTRLNEMSKAGMSRYPMIVTLVDITTTVSETITVPSMTILVIGSTKAEFYADDRDREVFDPLLSPLADQLLMVLDASGQFKLSNTHNRTRRYLWGSQSINANPLNDHVDAIEINLFNTTIIQNC